METRRWTNPTQPQTLQIAVFLLYINAVFVAIYGGLFNPIGLLLIAGGVGGGYGIANEKRWGYTLALVVAGIGVLFALHDIISLMFAAALAALLLHPQSRDYQRIWFR
ncbi:MAG: hypothetical protein JF603_00160 [Acidobacteria bacterium]|nr:hypothetical protein [Acidobacteriota bacterium]